MTDQPTDPADAPAKPPARPPQTARYAGRPAKAAAAHDVHARTMKRPAETLHLAHHHLHPHGSDNT